MARVDTIRVAINDHTTGDVRVVSGLSEAQKSDTLEARRRSILCLVHGVGQELLALVFHLRLEDVVARRTRKADNACARNIRGRMSAHLILSLIDSVAETNSERLQEVLNPKEKNKTNP